MKKFRLYFDKDKEEEWLNEMSRQGWAMTEYFAGLYIFTSCEPGQYIYRIDMQGVPGRTPVWRNDYQEYIELVEETGAEYVCRWGWWLIFRREAAKGEFALYTDTESQIALYKRIRWMFLFIGILELSLALSNTWNVLHFLGNRSDSLGGIDIIFFASLVFVWSAAVGFFFMSLKFTRKIHSLRMKTF